MYCIRYGAEDQRGRLLSSSHRLIVSSFHVSSAHRLIVSSSHLLLTAVTSSSSHCRHIVASSHLHVISSPHTTNNVSQSHRLIVSSSHLLIAPSSSTINNSSSPLRLIDSSSHCHIVSASHHLITVAHHSKAPSSGRLIVWSSSRVLCCVCARAEDAHVCVHARAAPYSIGRQWRMRIRVVMGGGAGARGGAGGSLFAKLLYGFESPVCSAGCWFLAPRWGFRFSMFPRRRLVVRYKLQAAATTQHTAAAALCYYGPSWEQQAVQAGSRSPNTELNPSAPKYHRRDAPPPAPPGGTDPDANADSGDSGWCETYGLWGGQCGNQTL